VDLYGLLRAIFRSAGSWCSVGTSRSRDGVRDMAGRARCLHLRQVALSRSGDCEPSMSWPAGHPLRIRVEPLHRDEVISHPREVLEVSIMRCASNWSNTFPKAADDLGCGMYSIRQLDFRYSADTPDRNHEINLHLPRWSMDDPAVGWQRHPGRCNETTGFRAMPLENWISINARRGRRWACGDMVSDTTGSAKCALAYEIDS